MGPCSLEQGPFSIPFRPRFSSHFFSRFLKKKKGKERGKRENIFALFEEKEEKEDLQ